MTAPTTEERPVPTPGMRAGMAAPATRHGLCETARHWAAQHPDEPFPISPLLLVALCEHADEQASDLREMRRLRPLERALRACVRWAAGPVNRIAPWPGGESNEGLPMHHEVRIWFPYTAAGTEAAADLTEALGGTTGGRRG